MGCENPPSDAKISVPNGQMYIMETNKKKIIYWAIFGLAAAILAAATVIGLVGIIKDIDISIHASIVLVPIGLFVNVVNALVFNLKPDADKTK